MKHYLCQIGSPIVGQVMTAVQNTIGHCLSNFVPLSPRKKEKMKGQNKDKYDPTTGGQVWY